VARYSACLAVCVRAKFCARLEINASALTTKAIGCLTGAEPQLRRIPPALHAGQRVKSTRHDGSKLVSTR
jgi:hypothetical protein